MSLRDVLGQLAASRAGARIEVLETSADGQRRIWLWNDERTGAFKLKVQEIYPAQGRTYRGWRDDVPVQSEATLRAAFHWLDTGEGRPWE